MFGYRIITSWLLFFIMKSHVKLKPLIISVFGLATIASFWIFFANFSLKNNIKIAQAGSGDNVSGWAWSDNIGWISFNCTNDNSCGAIDYGVKIDSVTGNFSGYAWSDNIGWIDFAPTSGFPGAPNTGTHYDSATGNVTGWAKILTLGNDGWIKMSDDSVGVWNGKGVKINNISGDFSGWAWNPGDDPGIGWISFNCADAGAGGCTGHTYKVQANINTPPQAINLSAPNWSFADACQFYARQAFLRWEFFDPDPGAAQTAYQIVVNTVPNQTWPIIDTGKVTDGGSTTQYSVTETYLDYNSKYYWWVKVWDNNDVPSAWAEYDSPTDTPLEADDGKSQTFTTYKHEFPDVNFSWLPANPSKDEKTKFTDASKYYSGATPSTPINCDDANCDWLWTVPADATIDDPATSTPTIIFNSSGNQVVTLKVTDSDGYYCSLTETININVTLPGWKEVKPR